jgi:hypothetical protein
MTRAIAGIPESAAGSRTVAFHFLSLASQLGFHEPEGTTLVFSAAVSLIVLSAALCVVLSRKYPPKVEHWAYATVGTVLGFWLRHA